MSSATDALLLAVEEAVGGTAAVAIRDDKDRYLAVNSVWEAASSVPAVQAVGHLLSELAIVPLEQAEAFMAEDEIVRKGEPLVTTRAYHVSGVDVRFMSVRVYAWYRRQYYLIETSFQLADVPLKGDILFRWRGIESVLGELLASRLLLLGITNGEESRDHR